jgi:hypothetical protein
MKTFSRHIILLLISLFSVIQVFGQIDSSLVVTKMDVELLTTDYRSSRTQLMKFIEDNGVRVQNQTESKKGITIDFLLDKKQYALIENLLSQMGYIVSKRLNTINNVEKVKAGELELVYLNQKKEQYVLMLNKLDEKSDKYFELWKNIESLDETIYNKRREMLSYHNVTNDYEVSLSLNEEDTTPTSSRVTFVNMPGFEYSYLNIESPSPEITAKSYQGYFVKYLFTRGKSFAQTGAYKRLTDARRDTSSNQFSEMFIIAFGQDFYTRHLGRGERKFLNLYSGYTIGNIIASSEARKRNIFYLSPCIGLELFKNKYILLDTKVNYFIPFTYNRNMRGVSYSASFNFVF